MLDQGDAGYSLARNSRYRVHISHGDARACPALCLALRVEGFAVSTSINVSDLTLAISQETFDAVVLGPLEQGRDELNLIAQVRAVQRGTRVISIISRLDLDLALDALRAGAMDVLSHPVDVERLVTGVRKTIATPAALMMPLVPAPRTTDVPGYSRLTARERQVLGFIVAGRSNKEAGLMLHISQRTVEVHRARIMEKLGARNTADLVRLALA